VSDPKHTWPAFDKADPHDQAGEEAHKALTVQLFELMDKHGNDPETLYSLAAGALAAVASFSLAIAKPGSHRYMQAHIQSMVPWAFDQAAGMLPTEKLDS
jgi:hypothetical protein